MTHKTTIGNQDIYITTVDHSDGTLGKIMITIGKEGDEMRIYSVVATLITMLLEHEVPLEKIVATLKYQQMPPDGVTSNVDIPIALSICDYLGKWLELKYITKTEE